MTALQILLEMFIYSSWMMVGTFISSLCSKLTATIATNETNQEMVNNIDTE